MTKYVLATLTCPSAALRSMSKFDAGGFWCLRNTAYCGKWSYIFLATDMFANNMNSSTREFVSLNKSKYVGDNERVMLRDHCSMKEMSSIGIITFHYLIWNLGKKAVTDNRSQLHACKTMSKLDLAWSERGECRLGDHLTCHPME